MTDTPEIPEHEAHRLRWVWYRSVVSQKIGAGNKVICWALADHINREKGIAWPSHDTLAAETGISARQVRNSLRFLEKEKLIAIKRRGGGIASDGTRRSCEYELQRLDEVKAHELRVAEARARAKAKTKAKGSKPGNRLPGIADVPGNERSDNPETNGSKPGSLAHRDIPEISDNLTTDLTNNLNTDLSDQGQDSSGRINFEGINYSSTPDDPAWPSGNVAKARDQQHARIIVAKESLRQLGYSLDARSPPRIGGVNADAFVMGQFPPQALVEVLTLCTQGTLRRADLARALRDLGIPRGDDLRDRKTA